MGDQELLDRPARLLGERGDPRQIEAGQQQGEFFAAIAGDEHGVLERDQRQRFADCAQAGIACDVAIAVVVQLEMIDIDHHQRHRLIDLAGAPPFLLELTVKAAAVGKPGEAVEARQLFEMLVGDAQFLFARGELLRHVVERGGKRLELRDPGLLRRAHMEIAAADAGRGAYQGADRPDDELLAAEPRHEQDEDAEQRQLQKGDGGCMVDAGLHGVLVEADGETCLRPGHVHIGKNAPDAVKTFGRHRAFVAREHVCASSARRTACR